MVAGLFIFPFISIILAFAGLRRLAILFSLAAIAFEFSLFYCFSFEKLLIRW